jgi:predicted HD phosphohydrolase/sterol desaturase/sphingolipid hydroxylase (fatty acid hydroxylase superfamily)
VNALHYTIFALGSMFAVHGFVCCFEPELKAIKIQDAQCHRSAGKNVAERAFFTLLTSLLYTGLPVSRDSIFSFACFEETPLKTSASLLFEWGVISIVWDLYFYLAHKVFHVHPLLYKTFHKKHHEYKDPNCMVAYYVTYGSHLITEQLPMFVFGAFFTREVVLFNLYYGTFTTFLHHSGFDLEGIEFKFFGVRLKLGSLLPHLPLTAQSAMEHDIHHEKFFNNYALSFRYLDKMTGSFEAGRSPGFTEEGEVTSTTEESSLSALKKATSSGKLLAETDNTSSGGDSEEDSSEEDSSEKDVEEASFTALKHCTRADVQLLADKYNEELRKNLVNRVIGMLKDQDRPELKLGAKVTLYEHGLQTATRAFRDGASEEMVVAALLHDVGEMHVPSNHGEVPAALLRPYITPRTAWVLENHEIFQMYFYAGKVEGGENAQHRRDALKASVPDAEWWEACQYFCEHWDQAAFDPDYESKELGFFVPMVERVLQREPFWWDANHPKRGVCGIKSLEAEDSGDIEK